MVDIAQVCKSIQARGQSLSALIEYTSVIIIFSEGYTFVAIALV